MTAGRLLSGDVRNASVFTQCLQRFNDRSRVLDDIVGKLEHKEIPGKEYVKAYLRDQYRRNCKANTLRSTFTTYIFF